MEKPPELAAGGKLSSMFVIWSERLYENWPWVAPCVLSVIRPGSWLREESHVFCILARMARSDAKDKLALEERCDTATRVCQVAAHRCACAGNPFVTCRPCDTNIYSGVCVKKRPSAK